MNPQFQSSFIPKGSVATSATFSPTGKSLGGVPGSEAKRSIFGFIGVVVFVIALLLTGGVFAYKFYLSSQITKMGADLEAARQSLEPSTINDLARLNAKITSTKNLVAQHVVLTPLFQLLEANTLQAVRFTNFSYTSSGVSDTGGATGPTLIMKGSAHNYAAVALQSDAFNQNTNIKNPVFSDLSLDEKGNILFSVTAGINPALLSYAAEIKGSTPVAPIVSSSTPVTTIATSTATTTKATTASTTVNTKK